MTSEDEIDAMLRAAGGTPVPARPAGADGDEEHTITFSPGLGRRHFAAREEALWSDIESAVGDRLALRALFDRLTDDSPVPEPTRTSMLGRIQHYLDDMDKADREL